MHASTQQLNQTHSKAASGRGAAVIAYGLLLGSIMILITAPAAIALAYYRKADSADWVASHFRYQISTFWWAIAGLLAGVGVWWLLGYFSLASGYAWTLGYLVFTAELVWLVTRCAIGLNRLTSNEGMNS